MKYIYIISLNILFEIYAFVYQYSVSIIAFKRFIFCCYSNKKIVKYSKLSYIWRANSPSQKLPSITMFISNPNAYLCKVPGKLRKNLNIRRTSEIWVLTSTSFESKTIQSVLWDLSEMWTHDIILTRLHCVNPVLFSRNTFILVIQNQVNTINK